MVTKSPTHPFFEFLREYEFISDGTLDRGSFEVLSKKDIFELAQLFTVLVETQSESTVRGTFTHSVSISTSGRKKCEMVIHRFEKLQELSRFAIMYSDRVYIDNFFLDYEHFSGRTLAQLRENLFDDVLLVISMLPVLETGFIQFFTPEIHSCSTCFENAFDAPILEKIASGQSVLATEFLDNMRLEVLKLSKTEFKLAMDGPEKYFDHGTVLTGRVKDDRIGAILSNQPNLRTELKRCESVVLDRSVIAEIGFHEDLASRIATNVVGGLLTAKMRKTSFLTEDPLDLSLMRYVTSDPDIARKNDIALKHLTSIVPFVADLEVNELMLLRNEEEDAFMMYRGALRKAIAEFGESSVPLTDRDASELFSDVIAPKLASLDQRVKVAKESFIKKTVKSVVAATGVISFGLTTGIVSQEMHAIITALGLGKIGYEILKDAIPVAESTDLVKNEDYYFLWKAKKLANN